MGLSNFKLGQVSQFRTKPVWSVVAPIMSPSSSRTTRDEGLTYDEAVERGFEISQGDNGSRPWIRGQRVIEIRLNGEFHSFA